MIYYKYRWYLAICLSVFLQIIGYFYLLKTPLDEMQKLRHKEKIFMDAIQVLPLHSNIPRELNRVLVKRTLSEFEAISQVMKLFNHCHLNVLSINPLSITSSTFMSLKVAIKGRFKDFLIFLSIVSRTFDFIQIEDLIIQMITDNDSQVAINLTLRLLKEQKYQNENIFRNNDYAYSPQIFCPPQGFHGLSI